MRSAPDETPAPPTGAEMTALKKTEGENPIPREGEHVSYRSMDGTYWRAVVRLAQRDGRLSIEVLGNPPLELSHRPWHAGDPADCPKRACTHISQAEKQR